MRPLVHIPLIFLAALTVFVAWVLVREVPFREPFAAAPSDTLPEAPALNWGRTTLEGRLIAASGEPVREASVFSLRRGRPLWASTDGSGAFVLEGVDPGPLELAIMARGFESVLETVEAQAAGAPLEIVLTRPLPERPDFSAGPRTDLVGWVELPLAGPDKSGYQLLLEPLTDPADPRAPVPRRQHLAADGSFRFAELQHGDYRVVLLPEYAAESSTPNLLGTLRDEPQPLFHGADNGPLELFARCGALEGVAQARDDAGEHPLEGGLVQAEPFSIDGEGGALGLFPPTRTGPDGRWRLDDLPAGRYRLRLTAGADRREAVVTVPEGRVLDAGL